MLKAGWGDVRVLEGPYVPPMSTTSTPQAQPLSVTHWSHYGIAQACTSMLFAPARVSKR